MNFGMGSFLFPNDFATPPARRTSAKTTSGGDTVSLENQRSTHSDNAQPRGPPPDGSAAFEPQSFQRSAQNMVQQSIIAPPADPNTRIRASTSQDLDLDTARREYVAQQQVIRNMPPNYNPLPIPCSTATNPRLPPDPNYTLLPPLQMCQPLLLRTGAHHPLHIQLADQLSLGAESLPSLKPDP